jgi:hypothetical protein
MVKKEEEVPYTKTEKLLVCEECSRRFEDTDVTWLSYEPKVKCQTRAKYLYPNRKQGTKYDTYQSALFIYSKWKVGICDFCASEKYNIDSVQPRDLDDALFDSGEPLADGGIVNNYETVSKSETKKEQIIYCNRCGSAHENCFEMAVNPEYRLDDPSKGMRGKCYVNKNWSLGWSESPSWQDVTEVDSDEIVHLCPDCFDSIKPSTLFRIKRGIASKFF